MPGLYRVRLGLLSFCIRGVTPELSRAEGVGLNDWLGRIAPVYEQGVHESQRPGHETAYKPCPASCKVRAIHTQAPSGHYRRHTEQQEYLLWPIHLITGEEEVLGTLLPGDREQVHERKGPAQETELRNRIYLEHEA